MALNLGSGPVSALRLGTATPSKVMLGTTQVWPTVPWTPADITTTLWLDGSDPLTIFESSGQVTEWRDKSGNNYHATQGDSAWQPIYLPAFKTINFPGLGGSGRFLRLPQTMPVLSGQPDFAAFVVAEVAEGGQYGQFVLQLVQQSPNRDILVLVNFKETETNTAFVLQVGNSDTGDSSAESIETTGLNAGDSYLFGSEWDTTRTENYGYDAHHIDGTIVPLEPSAAVGPRALVTPGPFGSTPGATISDGWNGINAKLSLLVLMRASVYRANIQKLEGWAAHKWNATSLLPPNHPYKNSPPTK